jgi:translation initiation factor IF-2
MVTMNQRLDAETLTIVADEFGYEVEFITVDIEDSIVEDREEDLVFRALLLL